MHSTIISCALSAALASLSLAMAASTDSLANPAGQGLLASRDLAAAPARSRHAIRQAKSVLKPLKKRQCKPKKTTNTTSGSSGSSSGGTIGDHAHDNGGSSSGSGSGSSSGSGINTDMGSEFLKYGNIYMGFLPDDGSGGGQAMSMADINGQLPAKSAYYGRYAQVTNGKRFDGSQIRSVMNDVKQSGGILQASIMPYKTWYGLTESDNSNAIAIAQFCKEMQDQYGVEIWLRFAHEMNWYQTDGTYTGSVQDFQTGWKVLSNAIDDISPDTKMFWSPNFESSLDSYRRYYPKEGRVDIVGFDWYPKSAGDINFLKWAKSFHDEFAVNGIKMVQGETGLQYHASDAEKMEWVKQLSSSETQQALPNYIGWAWQKYENGKDLNFKIVEPRQASAGINQQFKSFLAQ